MSQLICTRPYEWFEIHRNGIVFMCCPAWLKRPIGNLLEQSIAEIWNGPLARELRKSILNSSFHNCSRTRCPFLLAKQDPVQTIAQITSNQVQSAIRDKETILPYLPQRLNLCFDHSCNLSCPSCREQHLTMEPKEQDRNKEITAIIKEELLPVAQEVTMSGYGDPFASKAYLDILDGLNTQGKDGAKLRLHSNGMLWTEQRWNRFSNLHQRVTAAEISVDAATSETYQKNRPGGSFSRLLTNLDYLAQQPFNLTLSMVVQTNNFMEIPLFIELAQKHGARAYFSQLVNWGTFSKTEFRSRAIHLPDHPRHHQLREVLTPLATMRAVDLGNLKSLLSPLESDSNLRGIM